jgi:hypothetical protein
VVFVFLVELFVYLSDPFVLGGFRDGFAGGVVFCVFGLFVMVCGLLIVFSDFFLP